MFLSIVIDTGSTDSKKIRDRYWSMLRSARQDFNKLPGFTPTEFWDWLCSNYGIKAQFHESGNVTNTADIVDEKKYLMFLLKYGK